MDTEQLRLTPADISGITGIDMSRPVAQRNCLRKWGIKAEVNARREVVCFWSWVHAAGLSAEMLNELVAAIKTAIKEFDADDDDIGMTLEALDKHKSCRRRPVLHL